MRSTFSYLSLTFLVTSVVNGFALDARAQWQPGGVTVSAGLNDQIQVVTAPDGLGGAIVAWYDTRNGTTSIYARKIDRYGVPQWTIDGVAICTATNVQDNPQIASDGAGGAIITWEDKRTGTFDIYAQRVNASGATQWSSNGVAVCTAAGAQELPQIMSDGAGGAFIAWQDLRTGSYDVYAQRVNASGAAQWTGNGVGICTAGQNQLRPAMVSDGAGGFLVAWQDNRISGYWIWIQLVNSSGVAQWTPNGLQVSQNNGDQVSPQIISDGAGGAIVGWQVVQTVPVDAGDVYVQRVTSLGVPWWANNGLVIASGPGTQANPQLVPDGAGGAIIVYENDHSTANTDIQAQRVNASGVGIWWGIGIPVCSQADDQERVRVAPDSAGGAIVVWNDWRSPLRDIYGQRLDANGNAMWTGDGIPIGYGFNEQIDPVIVADGSGGSIMAWNDNRGIAGYDIYMQRIEDTFGYWGHAEPNITSVTDVPADQGGKVKLNWTASDQDRSNIRSITHYSLWRATDVALSASGATVIDNPAKIPAGFHGRAIYREQSPATDYYWEWIGNQDATFDKGYSFAAETRADSVAGHLSVHQFRVIAHTSDDYVLFKSLPAFGYSVDNLSPPPPLMLTAQRIGSDVHLKWNRSKAPDLRDYSIYRKTSTGVTPVPVNFLSSASDTLAVDAGAPASALYYIVTALDVHANQSPPSNEAGVSASTGAGSTPALTELRVRPNHPNPYSSSTELEVGLPSPSDITVQIYDVSGRRVDALVVRGATAGWRRIAYDGRAGSRAPLANGVYFYRVSAAGKTITHKMVIAR